MRFSPFGNNKAALKLASLCGGFLRALFESQFLRSKNGRVAQQPAKAGKLAAVPKGAEPHVPIGESRPGKSPGRHQTKTPH
jgi:hypothetical protein